jgi:hypothetical protein
MYNRKKSQIWAMGIVLFASWCLPSTAVTQVTPRVTIQLNRIALRLKQKTGLLKDKTDEGGFIFVKHVASNVRVEVLPSDFAEFSCIGFISWDSTRQESKIYSSWEVDEAKVEWLPAGQVSGSHGMSTYVAMPVKATYKYDGKTWRLGDISWRWGSMSLRSGDISPWTSVLRGKERSNE